MSGRNYFAGSVTHVAHVDRLSMPPRPKIQGGTPMHGEPSLCATCKFAFKIKGTTIDEDYVKCNSLGEWITFKVTECMAHHPFNQPTLDEMFPLAWLLLTKKDKREIGFMRYKDLTDEERFKFDRGHNDL